jgi:hypothetical protein
LPQTEVIYFDEKIPTFGLRVRASGSRSFIVQYKYGSKQTGTKQRRITIGPLKGARAVSLGKAKEEAREIISKVRLKQDPQGDRAKPVAEAMAEMATETFKEIAERFLARQEKRLRPSSHYTSKLYLLTHLKPLHALKLTSIDRATAGSGVRVVGCPRSETASAGSYKALLQRSIGQRL